MQRFQAEVRKNESERLIVQQEIIEAENRINSLLGRYPQPIARPSVDFLNVSLNALNTGLPPELLRNRADIRQAERDVQAAGLDVQVAKAASILRWVSARAWAIAPSMHDTCFKPPNRWSTTWPVNSRTTGEQTRYSS